MRLLKKVAVLISHIPNPRILKRIKTLENNFLISLIYWDRMQPNKESFEINPKHNVFRINIKAPLGKPIKRIIPFIKYLFRSIKILKKEKPYIIHSANLDMLIIAYIYKTFFDRNVKIIYEVADLPNYVFVKRTVSFKTFFARLIQKLEKLLTSQTSKIILTSPYFWDEYFSKFLDESKYLFIPNAPSKKIFNKYEKKIKDDFTVGYIGSVRYVEQLKMLIDVVGELDNNHIKIFIAGNGPGYKEIVEYASDQEFVEIYGAYNYENEIVSLYEKVDCMYSVYDIKLKNVKLALPNRLYESIVCSIPIIGAKDTMLGKFIEKNQIGITVNYDSKEELKEALERMVSSKKLLKFYQNNCNKIKSRFYYENNSEKLLNEYRKLIK